MKDIYREFLFSKGYFVAESEATPDAEAVTLTLAKKFNIVLYKGEKRAALSFVRLAAHMLGENVPEPFYQGFPKSLAFLSREAYFLDQALHYIRTYGFGDFSEAGRSVFEEPVLRQVFSEKAPLRYFAVLSQEEAKEKILEAAKDLLRSTRPLPRHQYLLLLEAIRDYRLRATAIPCKETAVSLLVDTGKITPYAKGLWGSDLVKVTEAILRRRYPDSSLRQLSLKTRDKKLLSRLLDYLFAHKRVNTKTCYEKKATMAGILHHIHYKPKCEAAEKFLAAMRGKENRSAYSAFEAALARGDALGAAELLRREKGASALSRNLLFLLSRASAEDAGKILSMIEGASPMVFWQLLLKTKEETGVKGTRAFAFHHNGLRIVHNETPKEASRRKSGLTKELAERLYPVLEAHLAAYYKGKLGRVYIDEDMKRVAIPLEESTSMGGAGVLPAGSYIPLGEGKKLRVFTYWEKVNDIDLSALAYAKTGEMTEFSWRTMFELFGEAILFSGDQTSGYEGGSEYFDIDLDKFRKRFPKADYVIFYNNVYSATNFDECICRAGFMQRDILDTGEVFEPRTVETSFRINCPSTSAYLLALDVRRRRVVWLNKGKAFGGIVAALSGEIDILRLMHRTDYANLYGFFSMLASEVVDTPEKAEVVLSDKPLSLPEGVSQIRSSDIERVIALLNA